MSDVTDRIVRLRDQGMTWNEIAAEVGGTYCSVRSRYRHSKRDRKRRESRPEPDEPPKQATAEEVKWEGGPNCAEVVSESRRIRTLEDLIAAAHIDTKLWTIERYVVNKWEVGAKCAERKLTYESGRVTGTIDDPGHLTIEPLWQVKAWLVRKKPEAIELAIRPVQVTATIPPRSTKPDRGDGLHFGLILPDIQTGFRRDLATGALDPFHDRAALDVALQIAQARPFDRLVFLGDWLDMTECASDKFPKSPAFYWTVQPAILELDWWVTQFRLTLPNADIDAIEGNHEQRMTRALMEHLVWAYQLRAAHESAVAPALSVPKLLGLSALRVDWHEGYPDATVWLNDELCCTHGNTANGSPGDTARAVVIKSASSVVFGHIHRREMATKTVCSKGKPRPVTAASPGCLCRVDGVVPGHALSQNWQQGVAVVAYDDEGFSAVTIVPIQDGRAIFDGRSFVARDRLRELRSDTGYKF